MPREGRGRPFADADDSEVGAAHHGDLEVGQFALQRDGGHEPGTAGAEDEDVSDAHAGP